jgi:methylenetetrahydrofolate dehydrogenase (NADP+)/methenyltetrahydrofolate cyclohydrolase
MPGRILDGAALRDQILAEAKPRVSDLIARRGRAPGLAVVLVGENPASEVYVRNKIKACADLGIYSEKHTPPAASTTSELLELVNRLNADPKIDGILVQMPLPDHVDAARVLHAVAPYKDADGFHPYNVGLLVANVPAPRACTPHGVMEILRRQEIPLSGRHAVVVGRSDIVGKPMALMLLHANCTVTVCHSKTANLPEVCRQADILVAALGRPAFLGANHIKPGAVVIDVGINRIPAEMPGKSKLIGDVDPAAMAELSSAYTPVPGGVGPLTVAMLMLNTIGLAEQDLA